MQNVCQGTSDEKKYVSLFISLALSISMTSVVLLVLSKTLRLSIDTKNMQELLALPMSEFAPEPLENMLFISGVLMMPVLLLLSCKISNRIMLRTANERLIRVAYVMLSSAFIVCLYLIGWFGMRRDKFFFVLNAETGPLALLMISAATLLLYFVLNHAGEKSKGEEILTALLGLLTILLVAIAGMFCVYGINTISESKFAYIYSFHFNAVFHAMAQVYNGKELLVDLTHLYGLYPQFLEPVFRVFGLSVFRFTLVMGGLLCLSFLALRKFLNDMVSNRILAHLGFIAILYYNYFFTKIITYDPYFQYHPIRFLFPALSIYLTYRYFKHGDTRTYYLCFALYSIAILWNFDTGFVVYASWVLTIVYHELYARNYRYILKHILNGIIALASTVLLFTLYMFARYEAIPDYGLFFLYQKIFYKYGYMMMRMPVFHPWNLIILTYIIGLLYSIYSLVENKQTITAKMTFFLSVLGTGLFAYYQGRSQHMNLSPVSFPAIILITMFADIMLSRIAIRNKVFDRVALLSILFFMIFSFAGLLKNYSGITDVVVERVRPVVQKMDNQTMRSAKFIRESTNRGEEVLILSNLSGVYYLDSATTCPLNIAGNTELSFWAEYEKIFNYLRGDQTEKVIIDDNFYTIPLFFFDPNLGKKVTASLNDILAEKYQLARTSPDKNIKIFFNKTYKNNLASSL